MGRVLRWIGYIFGGIVLLLVLAVAGLFANANLKLNARVNNPVPEVTVARTAAQVERGAYLASAIPACGSCHSSNPQATPLVLDGGRIDAGPFGTFYPPNLTPGGKLRDYSDGEIVRAIREGISRDGRPLVLMPSQNLKEMSDEDVQSVVAFLRRQPCLRQAFAGPQHWDAWLHAGGGRPDTGRQSGAGAQGNSPTGGQTDRTASTGQDSGLCDCRGGA